MRVIHAALDAGVRLLDTADVYCLSDEDLGHNERLMARALREWNGPRDEVIVATKGGMTRPQGSWDRNGRPEHLRRACDRSLQALGVDRIDLYQFHAPDPRVPFGESIGMLAELQAAGKIRWLGLSNVSVDQINAARRHIEVVTVQNRLNPFFREALTEGVVEHCEDLGIGFLAYSPVGGGRLNQKLPIAARGEVDRRPSRRLGARRGPGLGAGAGLERDRHSWRPHRARTRSTAGRRATSGWSRRRCGTSTRRSLTGAEQRQRRRD